MALGLSLLALLAVVTLAILIHDFFEGETLVADILDEWRLSRLSLAQAAAAWAANPRRSDVVVSLTSTPSRLPHIEATLKSLMRQSLAPQRIVLNLPLHSLREDRPYIVPEGLSNLPGLELHRCDDLGPATKLVPTLGLVPPDQRILVVDDDRIYPERLLETLLNSAVDLPDAALGCSGWRAPADLIDRPTTILSNLRMLPPAPVRARRLHAPVEVDVLQGFSGYLVCAGFFDPGQLLAMDSAPPAARTADDVWISGHCAARRFVAPADRGNYQPKLLRPLYRRTSLGLVNQGPGDPAFRANSIVLRHLAGRWLVERQTP